MPANDDEARMMLSLASKDDLGELGERIWSQVLADSGYHYVSLTKICEGGAPLARNKECLLILPDFDSYRDGRSQFVEAKVKTQSIVYRNKRQERHGINQRNYLHYLEIQKRSGKPCCIGIVELFREDIEHGNLFWSGSLLLEKLSDLMDPRSENPESPPKVYWRRKQFRELESGLAPTELFAIGLGHRRACYGFELQNIFCPQKQIALF